MTGSPRAGAICGAIVGLFLAWATGRQRALAPPRHAIELKSEAELKEILEANRIVLAAFYPDESATWTKQKAVMQELAVEYAGRAVVVTIKAEKFGNLVQQHGVTTIPETKIFVAGKVERTIPGLRAKDEYTKILDELLAEQSERNR